MLVLVLRIEFRRSRCRSFGFDGVGDAASVVVVNDGVGRRGCFFGRRRRRHGVAWTSGRPAVPVPVVLPAKEEAKEKGWSPLAPPKTATPPAFFAYNLYIIVQ